MPNQNLSSRNLGENFSCADCFVLFYCLWKEGLTWGKNNTILATIAILHTGFGANGSTLSWCGVNVFNWAGFTLKCFNKKIESIYQTKLRQSQNGESGTFDWNVFLISMFMSRSLTFCSSYDTIDKVLLYPFMVFKVNAVVQTHIFTCKYMQVTCSKS